MARIRTIGPREARGEVKTIYGLVEKAFPLVPNVFQAFSIRPALLRAVWEGHLASIQTGKLARRTKEAVAVQTSRANACPYCVGAHKIFLNGIGMSEAEVTALESELAGERPGPLADLWRFVEEVVARPKTVPASLAAAAARACGGEREFLEAIAITGFFTRVNLVVNALGVLPDLPGPLMRFRLGERIGRAVAGGLTRLRVDFTPKSLSPRPPEETLDLLAREFEASLGAPLPDFYRRFAICPEILESEIAWLGATLRPEAIPAAYVPIIEAAAADEEGFSRFGGGGNGGAEAGGDRAAGLARRVAGAAYRLLDEDFEDLRASGLADEALLEIVASAAFWCGTRRLAAALEPPLSR